MIDFNKYDFIELSDNEYFQINGGSFWGSTKRAAITAGVAIAAACNKVVDKVVTVASSFKTGFKDGWNDTLPQFD